MKSFINCLFLIFGVLLANIAHAESPREQLSQMVEQLQQSPNDNALREKIIKLAPTLKPSPALPDAAVSFEGRAQFAFRSAKSEDDFLAAAREYEKAVAAAPWILGYYADLCTIYEKAGKFEDAKRHCGFYLIGLTDPAQITDVKRRIAGLEFGIEKANSPQAKVERERTQADREREEFAAFLRQNEGAIFKNFDWNSNKNISWREAKIWSEAKIENGAVFFGTYDQREDFLRNNPHERGRPTQYSAPTKVTGFTTTRDYQCDLPNHCLETLTFSRDGMSITRETAERNTTKTSTHVYQRQ